MGIKGWILGLAAAGAAGEYGIARYFFHRTVVRGNAKRDTLQQVCGFGEDNTRDLLKDLIIKGMVSKEGPGKVTYYRLNSAS